MTLCSECQLCHFFSSPQRDGQFEVDVYEPTVPMSTYLVAFVVSDFKCASRMTSKNILVEICARRNAIEKNLGEYALGETATIIDFFVDYFNVSYPLSKSSEFFAESLASKVICLTCARY